MNKNRNPFTLHILVKINIIENEIMLNNNYFIFLITFVTLHYEDHIEF